MKQKLFTLSAFTVGAAAFVLSQASYAAPINPFDETSEIHKYLIIGTGNPPAGDNAAVDLSNVELGADQEVVSNSDVGSPSQKVKSFQGGLDLTGTWVPNDGENAAFSRNRWNDVDPDHPNDTVGVPDILPMARPVFEGIDASGNIAITGANAEFEAANSDLHADLGVQCNRSAASCFPNPGSPSSWFPDETTSVGDAGTLAPGNGISQFDPAALVEELEMVETFIDGLTAELTITNDNDFTNRNIKDSALGPVKTNLDLIDTNGDGIAVIDIALEDVGDVFDLNNTDWILQSDNDVNAIIRILNNGTFAASNSSILLGDVLGDNLSPIDELGAIFYIPESDDLSTNEVFNLNNAILGGIGLYDFTGNENAVINLQDAQGCAQFISNQILMSNNRWNRCSGVPGMQVPVPATAWLFAIGLMGLGLRRRLAA